MEEKQFIEFQKKISQEKLSKSVLEELKNQYYELRPLGKLKALELAYKFVSSKSPNVRNNGTALPPSGQPKKLKANDIISIAKDEKAWQTLVKQSQ